MSRARGLAWTPMSPCRGSHAAKHGMAASLAARKNFTMGSTVARGADGKSEHSGKTASVVRCVVDHTSLQGVCRTLTVGSEDGPMRTHVTPSRLAWLGGSTSVLAFLTRLCPQTTLPWTTASLHTSHGPRGCSSARVTWAPRFIQLFFSQ